MARNKAIKESKGDYILLFDDDSRVSKDWVSNHLKCIDFFDVKISAGVSISKVGDKIPPHYSYFRWGDQLDTGNVMIRKDVFKDCGLFDTKFEKMRMGDNEFGTRCYLNGINIISNPKAKRIHLKTEVGGLRTFGHWDGLRTFKFFKSRPVPSILYLFRKYWGDNSTIFYLLQIMPISLSPYKYKGKTFGHLLSLSILIIFLPIIFIQVLISWNKSSKLLSMEDKIEFL